MHSLEFNHSFHHRGTWDRFIRRRDEIQRRFLGVPNDCLQCDHGDAIINQKLYSKSEDTYKRLLASAMSLRAGPDPWVPQWPVKSRCKSYLHSPRVVLDLPQIHLNHGCNIVDWSATSYLTVAFPRSVYLWHSTTNRTLKMETKNTCCLKWNNEGNALFLAARNGGFNYTDASTEQNLFCTRRTSCHLGCYVSCCAFHPSSPVMYIGCCKGSVSAYHINKGLHIITVIHEDHQQITVSNLGLSCDGRHLAIAAMTDLVFVYDTTKFAVLCTIVMTGPSRALAWHPWKRNLLVVSDCNGFMALFDMLEPMTPKASYFSTLDSSILNLTFNPISAELVVSQKIYYNSADRNLQNQTQRQCTSQVNVLSSFDRVVDRMAEHVGGHIAPVYFLNWNPDGTQLGRHLSAILTLKDYIMSNLWIKVAKAVFNNIYHIENYAKNIEATAGDDETMRIWDFLPSKIKQRTKKTSCELNYVSASIEMGTRMGLAIR